MAATGRIGWTGAATAALSVNAVVLTLLALEDRRPLAQRPTPNRPVLFMDLEPVPRLKEARPSARRREPGTAYNRTRSREPGSTPPSPVVASAAAPGVEQTQPQVDPRWRVAPGTVAPASLPLSCDTPLRLTLDNRRRCDLRWSGRGETARVLTGSGDAERDARFARQGARRLAAWEAQRAEPPQGDPPCENPNPVAGCAGVNIQVELFSSRDGLLPNLRKRRE